MNIDPKKLNAIRTAKGLTFKEMKKRSGLSLRNLKKLESEKEGKDVKPNKRTIDGLCKALGVEPGHLSGELDLPPEVYKKAEGEPTRRSVSLRFGRKQELELIQRVYRVSAEQVMNMAPFLFVLMAEGSLKWRREMVQDIYDTLHKYKNANHLSFAHTRNNWGADFHMFLDFEDDSISSRDIFGESLQDNEIVHGVDTSFRTENGNPFSDYLCKLAKEISEDFLEVYSRYGDELPSYELLRGEMEKVCRGNHLCREAIRWGDFSIKDIPEDLDDIEEFNAWVEANTSQNTKDLDASFRQLREEIKI